MSDKVLPLSEAIARYVRDGDAVALGMAQETLIPFAAGHEIIRQGKRDLTLIAPISDMLFDQLIGAGCVRAVHAAWVGNVITGSAYNFRRAAESGQIQVVDYSNLLLAMALRAAAWGLPFLPTRSALGSDLPQTNPHLKIMRDPFNEELLLAVQALRPDVTILHVQRADRRGNVHLWGNLGMCREAALAADRVLITCEEIVSDEVIRSDPNRIPFPNWKVCAVAEVPWGAHPSPVPGCYNRDHRAFLEYRDQSRTAQDFACWLETWVLGGDWEAYLARLGAARLDALRIRHPAPSAPVDFGY